VNGWLRRLGMRIRGARHMRRRARGYHPGARHVKVDCLPRTPRAAARCEQCGSRDRALIGGELMCARCGAVPVSQWEPRIARWVPAGASARAPILTFPSTPLCRGPGHAHIQD
jgi:hypothetical protein